jgi:hypothetical protein
MPFVDPFAKLVVARFLDFFGSKTQWQRRLWGSGIVLTLREVLEASQAVRAGILHAETLGDLTNFAGTVAGRDPGVGTAENKHALQNALKKTMVPEGVESSAVKLIVSDLENHYLDRWKDAIVAGKHPGPERTARAIAAHLLDSGYSSVHLHKWCTYHARSVGGAKTLAELLDHASALLTAKPKLYKILVGFHSLPPSKSGFPDNYLAPDVASSWLRRNSIDVSQIRLNGALLFHVPARDTWAAIQTTVDNVDQLTSRVALGTNSQLRPTGQAWIDRITETFSFKRDPRLVEVHALHRENKLYSQTTTSIVDAALELLGSLNTGPGSSAVGAGWAAIEALLSGPADPNVIAAERMAALVACAFLRAELTYLSYQMERTGGALATALAACTTNRDRSFVVAEAITNGHALSLTEDSDLAALERMRRVLASQSVALHDIQHHVACSFRRLYRVRNLVLHGGHTDALGLSSVLRTSAPLVGAGIDRIAHAYYVDGVRPMELAAKADIGLTVLGSKHGVHPVDLLS